MRHLPVTGRRACRVGQDHGGVGHDQCARCRARRAQPERAVAPWYTRSTSPVSGTTATARHAGTRRSLAQHACACATMAALVCASGRQRNASRASRPGATALGGCRSATNVRIAMRRYQISDIRYRISDRARVKICNPAGYQISDNQISRPSPSPPQAAMLHLQPNSLHSHLLDIGFGTRYQMVRISDEICNGPCMARAHSLFSRERNEAHSRGAGS